MPERLRVLVLPPESLRREIFQPGALERLEAAADVSINDRSTNWTSAELAAAIPGVDAVIASWGSPKFDQQVLAAADRLRFIGYAAGSIKNIVPSEVFDRGVVVSHAADLIADSVAELCLGYILTIWRQIPQYDQAMHAHRPWREITAQYGYGHGLYYKTIGLIGCGMVARKFIRLLKPFEPTILVYDPYLSDERAAELGVTKVSLEELFERSDVISNHLPTTPETTRMIRAEHLRRIRDGALFINTARAASVDYDALLDELRKNRFQAALDVFPQEPLPEDSPFRDLPNVVLTPHRAGSTIESRQRLGTAMIDELLRFFRGEPLRYQVRKEQLAIMA